MPNFMEIEEFFLWTNGFFENGFIMLTLLNSRPKNEVKSNDVHG